MMVKWQSEAGLFVLCMWRTHKAPEPREFALMTHGSCYILVTMELTEAGTQCAVLVPCQDVNMEQ